MGPALGIRQQELKVLPKKFQENFIQLSPSSQVANGIKNTTSTEAIKSVTNAPPMGLQMEKLAAQDNYQNQFQRVPQGYKQGCSDPHSV